MDSSVDPTTQPTSLQRHLLQAAFLSGHTALAAWQAWRDATDLSGPVDADTFRLFPQLYRNLQRLGVDDPRLGRLKGVYRQAWYKNQLLLRAAAAALSSLQQANVEALLMDGAARCLLCTPPDFGLHSLPESAALIRAGDVAPAIRALQASGWQMEWSPADVHLEEIANVVGSQLLRDAAGNRLRLCWHILPAARPSTAADDPFVHARPAQLHGQPVRTLDATDLLLAACTGPSWGPPPLLWRVADAALVLALAGPEIQWERVVDQTRRRRLAVLVAQVLGAIQENLDAPVPPHVLERVRALPTAANRNGAFDAATQAATLLGRLPAYWHDYAQYTTRQGRLRRAAGFPRYLQQVWRLDHLWQVPLRIARQAAYRLAGRRT